MSKVRYSTVKEPNDVPNSGVVTEMLKKACSCLGITIKKNLFRQRKEIHRKGGKVTELIGEMNEVLYSEIQKSINIVDISKDGFLKAKYPFKMSQRDFNTVAINSLAYSNRYDPAIDWLKTIKEVDMQPTNPLREIFKILPAGKDECELNEYVDAVFWSMMRGIVRRIYYTAPNDVINRTHHSILVLIGDQGVLKTSFFEYLLPFSDWFCHGISLVNPDRNTVERIQGKLLAEAGELALGKADNAALKDFITRPVDTVDFKYQNTDDYPRRCIFVATTNDAQCLPNDPSGHRRYHIVHVAAKEDEKLTKSKLKAKLDEMRDSIFGYAKYQVFTLKMTSEIDEEFVDMQKQLTEDSITRNLDYEDYLREALEAFLDLGDKLIRKKDYVAFKRRDFSEFYKYYLTENGTLDEVSRTLDKSTWPRVAKRHGYELDPKPTKINGKSVRLYVKKTDQTAKK